MRLAGARALVTGASGGIGAAVVRELAGRGAVVVATGRDDARLSRLPARRVTANLSEPAAVAALVEAAGAVDVAVLAAGVGWCGAVADMPSERLTELVTVNLTSVIELAGRLLPGMLSRGRGHLCFVGSIAGATGVAHEAAYSATKAAVATFADALRLEVARRGVTVSLVAPGVVETAFFARRGAAYDRSWPRPVRPERIARAVAEAIEHDHAEVFVPGWLRLPARLHGGLPGAYRRLATRFG